MLRLIELINSLTPYEVTSDNTIVGLPRLFNGMTNTIVTLEGTFDTGAYGKRDFKYNRANLAKVEKKVIHWTGEQNTKDLLSEINTSPIFVYVLGEDNDLTLKQAYLTELDIVIEDIIIKPLEKKLIKVKANPNSYLFWGELSVEIIG